MRRRIFCVVLAVFATGCFQAYNGDEELNTVPVTNNPNIIPNHGVSPGFGTVSR